MGPSGGIYGKARGCSTVGPPQIPPLARFRLRPEGYAVTSLSLGRNDKIEKASFGMRSGGSRSLTLTLLPASPARETRAPQLSLKYSRCARRGWVENPKSEIRNPKLQVATESV